MKNNKGFSQIVILLTVLVVVGFGYVVFLNVKNGEQQAQSLDSLTTLPSLNIQINEITSTKAFSPLILFSPLKKGGSIPESALKEINNFKLISQQKSNELQIKSDRSLFKKSDLYLNPSISTSTLGNNNNTQKINTSNTRDESIQNLRPRILYMGGIIDHALQPPYAQLPLWTNDVWDLTHGQVVPPPSASFNSGMSPGPWRDRTGFGLTYFNNQLWLVGGWTGHECTKEVWTSKDGGKNWILANANAPFGLRSEFTLTVFQNQMYLIGGLHCQDNSIVGDYTHITNDIWTSTDGYNWSYLTSNPLLARVSHQTVVSNNKLVITAGYTDFQGYSNDTISSTDGIIWNVMSPSALWLERAHHQSVFFNNKIYVFGGVKMISDSWFSQIWFSPTAGAGYFWGGPPITTSVYSDVWSSSDEGVTWIHEDANPSLPGPQDPLWGPREEHSAVVMNNRIYLIGGSKDPWAMPIFAERDIWNSTNGSNWTLVTPNASWVERANARAVVVPPGYGDGFFPPIPNVSTLGSQNITNSTIDLLGSYISPVPNVEWWFEWNLPMMWNYWNSHLTTANILSPNSSQTVTSGITGLSPQTPYFYRLVAQNSTGISYGPLRQATTSGCTTPPSIRVIYPNGSGESFITGQQINVTWNTCGIAIGAIMNIEIQTIPPSNIFSITTPNDGNETITIPSTITPGWYYINVANASIGLNDFSDAPFWIN